MTSRNGDTDPRSELFESVYPRLAGWARKAVDDDDVAHEIAAEAFTRLLGRWSRVDDPHAYLYRIAANLVTDHWRRGDRDRRGLLAAAVEQLTPAASPPGEAWELTDLLRTLPEPQSQAVLLHYLAGFSIRDVASMLGRPQGTVKSDLSQARTKLRKVMDPSHDRSA